MPQLSRAACSDATPDRLSATAPEMVKFCVATVPDAGLAKFTVGGRVSSVNGKSVGLLVFPAKSVARRWTTCAPSADPSSPKPVEKLNPPVALNATATKAPASTAACRDTTPEKLSVTTPATVGFELTTAPGVGLEIEIAGGAVSSVT
jgi:hypothetical protein